MPRTPSRIALLALLPLALAACGGEQGQVKSAATDYAHALADGDAAKACALLTPAAKAQLGGATCAQGVSRLHAALSPKASSELRGLKVGAVAIHGRTASITADVAPAAPAQLRKVGKAWLVDATPAID